MKQFQLELKKSELREKLRPIALPKPFQKFGVLHILIKKPNVFFFDLENFVSRRILFHCEEKKYRLCYAIRFDYKDENMPSIVLDESEKVAFNEIPVENEEYLFLMTEEPIYLTNLQDVNCYAARVSEENETTRLRCKVPKFSLMDLTSHPTYPPEQILLREKKLSTIGEEVTIFQFILDKKGNLDKDSINNTFVQLRSGNKD